MWKVVSLAVVIGVYAIWTQSAQEQAGGTCPDRQIPDQGRCPAGCYVDPSPDSSTCMKCEDGYFNMCDDLSEACGKCTPCSESVHEEQDKQCTTKSDRCCRCKPGYDRDKNENCIPKSASITPRTTRPTASPTPDSKVPVQSTPRVPADCDCYKCKQKCWSGDPTTSATTTPAYGPAKESDTCVGHNAGLGVGIPLALVIGILIGGVLEANFKKCPECLKCRTRQNATTGTSETDSSVTTPINQSPSTSGS